VVGFEEAVYFPPYLLAGRFLRHVLKLEKLPDAVNAAQPSPTLTPSRKISLRSITPGKCRCWLRMPIKIFDGL
jgi:hypothetical protein